MKTRSFAWLCLLALPLLLTTNTSHAQPAEESDLRAAIIFRLLQFSQWQLIDNAQINLCIYANGKGTQSFSPLHNQILHNDARIHIRQLKSLEIQQCDVIVIGSEQEFELGKAHINTFVVCNNCKKNIKHAAINLFRSDDKLKYNINRTIANSNGIHFRSAVLKSAQRIIGAE